MLLLEPQTVLKLGKKIYQLQKELKKIREKKMISEKEFKNYEEALRKQKEVEQIYEIIEQKNLNEILPNYDLQDEKLTQDILEVYKIVFWGISALVSTILWLFFFTN